MDDIVKIALDIATNAHKGQVDKSGKNYIEHPKYVASLVTTPQQKAVALLHDVVEDTSVTLKGLAKVLPQQIVNAVEAITKNEEDKKDYFAYLKKVKNNELAKVVKIADMTHNSMLSRLSNPTEKDYQRVEKYKKGLEFLQQ